MAKTYKGSLSLEWYNKQRSILLSSGNDFKVDTDIQAPRVNWINKDEALYYEIDESEGKGKTPYWVDRNDIRVKEARPLIFQQSWKAVSTDKPGSLPGTICQWKIQKIDFDDQGIENILIKGDNLLSLNTLKQIFNNKEENEKVKLVYLDPPFNTGGAFDHYDDNLSHSEWLTMLRDRLVLLKELLRRDGFIFIHLDDSEVHYCKIVCDEIFGRSNFISHITYERSGVAGLGQGGFLVNTTEHLLFYRNFFNPDGNNIESYPLDFETIKRYSRILRKEGNKKLIREFTSKSNKKPVRVYEHTDFVIESIPLKNFKEREKEIRKFIAKNVDKMFRENRIQKENAFQNDLISSMDKSKLYTVEYSPSRGKFKDENTKLYYLNQGLLSWLGDNSEVNNDEVVKSLKLTTLWDHQDIPKADIANEGNVNFPRGKKPENLIKRLLDLCTSEGDIVLDCFGGSGTTSAVAHKMKRKWIAIEIGNQANTHIIPRMKSILSGTDKLGISKKVNWTGGGSFKYYHLGPSIIFQKEKNMNDFNWSLGHKFIEKSFLSSYDYTPLSNIDLLDAELFQDPESSPTVGIQRFGAHSRVAIITLNPPTGRHDMMHYDELIAIYSKIKMVLSPDYINIFTNRGVDIAFDSKPDDLEVIKIPHAIFAELEK